MDESDGPAAPASGSDPPTFEDLIADPEIAALLEFAPVPRRFKKEGGWNAHMQRLFIARLAVHGSPGKACDEVGMYRSGIDKVFKSAGAESFRKAWAKAVELAERRRAEQAAKGHASVAGLKLPFVDNRRKPRPPPSRPELSDADRARAEAEPGDTGEELTKVLMRRFVIKVGQEREARLKGEIVAADFYLRQISFFEVAIDLASTDLFAALEGLRRGGHGLLDIAETHASRFIDALRRAAWAEAGEPPRPPLRDDLMQDHGEFRTEPLECTWGGLAESHEEQRARFADRHRRDAEAQLRWEAEAYAEWERRWDSPSPHLGGEGRGEGAERDPGEGANDP